MPVPPPPDLTSVPPLTQTWPAGTEIWRVHQAGVHPDAFNATSSPGRFRPVLSGPPTYPATAAYAQPLYRFGRCDGLIWSSRHHSGSQALMLFGTRVRARHLRYDIERVEPLWKGVGFEEVAAAACDANVTLTV